MNNRYEIVVYWSAADDYFLAEVPELPSLITDGTSRQEAVQNAEEMIDAYLETARRESWSVRAHLFIVCAPGGPVLWTAGTCPRCSCAVSVPGAPNHAGWCRKSAVMPAQSKLWSHTVSGCARSVPEPKGRLAFV